MRRKAPLRKVVGERIDPANDIYSLGVAWDVLECGHELRQGDFERWPNRTYKRQCKHCAEAAKAALEGEPE